MKKTVGFSVPSVGAVGIGTVIGPVVSFAESTPSNTEQPQVQPPFQNGAVNGDCPQMGMRMGRYFAGEMHGTIAEALGLTVEELFSLRESGKSVAQIAEEQGISTEQLLKILIDTKTEHLDQLVKDEKITEEQKAAILENMETNMKEAITRTEIGPLMGDKERGKRGYRFHPDGDFQPGQGRGGFGEGKRWENN